MKKKILIFFIILTPFLLLSSCASSGRRATNMGTKSRLLQIGMTKDEAVTIMGKTYERINSVETPNGHRETIRYINSWPPNYILYFLDDSLIEWHEEKSK